MSKPEAIITPNYSPPKILPNLLPSKSKQLPSFSSLISKCLKIISMYSVLQAKNLQSKFSGKETIQIVSNLLDTITSLSKTHSYTHPSQIEQMLQRQQNLNRVLIKKELEYREEYKSIIDQLNEHKAKNIKLNEYINKMNEEIKDKDLTILHVKNQLKACQKERKIFDDCKFQCNFDTKFISYVSRDMERGRGNHKRRKSEDVGRKLEKNGQAKKKIKEKEKEKSKQLIQEKRKSSLILGDKMQTSR